MRSPRGLIGRVAGRMIPGLAAAAAALAAGQVARAQAPGPGPQPGATPPRVVVSGPAAAPGTATVGVPAADGPVLAPEVQVVRFHGPAGVRIEVLGPNPEPVPVGDGHGLATFGLKVGVGYRLRIANIPGRPDAELFPMVEVVGHLHRPPGIDPGKFPIRISFGEDDFLEAVDAGRLVTQVVYLEDPEQALPITLPKDEIPVVALGPTEDPIKVAAALGRVMAIVRMGGRRPSPEEINRVGGAELGVAIGRGPCPFSGPTGSRCGVPCGPVRGTAPPPGRPWVPRDEFLCDGGDRAEPIHFGGDGGLRGIDPRDALILFDDTRRPRILPTNVVCIYAPRFAELRMSLGPNEALNVQNTVRMQFASQSQATVLRTNSKRLVQNEAAEANRARLRASAMRGRVYAGEHAELRVLSGFDNLAHLAGIVTPAGAEVAKQRRKAALAVEKLRALGIKTAETAVITGIVQGAGEAVMAWPARETVGVELPPDKPGLAVVKRVSAGEAEAGQVVTFVIQYRNMGNTPIRAVSIIDSLLPRLDYVPGSAQGPAGTIFSTAENRVGSTELRWDLPGFLRPGAEGYVEFKAVVR